MTMNVSEFSAEYTSMSKSYRTRSPWKVNGVTQVVQCDPEDLPLIDDTFAWSSKANRSLADRTPGGSESYWGHITDLDHLHEVLRRGWEEGTNKILDLADRIRDAIPHPYGSRRVLTWQDQGDSVDMGRVYSGNLDKAWRSSPRRRERAPRVISLDVDVGENCMIGADDLFWSGAAAVALTDALEDAGYRVELFATSSTHFNAEGKRHAGLMRVRAKMAQERMNPALTAAMVALPATFRWYHLMAWLKHPYHIGYGFGKSGTVDAILQQAMERDLVEGAEVTLQNSLSEERAVEEVTTALERLTSAEGTAEGTMS